MPCLRAAAQTVPDSASQRDRAEDEQLHFERTHRRFLPIARGGVGGGCDEQLGRVCLRFDNGFDWDPTPEDPTIVSAREALLATLQEVGDAIPGDLWVLGQRIRYLGAIGRWGESERLAQGCEGGPPWWCDALTGYVMHRSGRVPEAETAFSRALDRMDPAEAEEWTDPHPLLDYSGRKWLGAPGDLSREEALRRFWALADPLFLTPGNERRTEHLARKFGTYLYAHTTLTLGLPWGSALERLLLRYGFVAGWERARPVMGEIASGRVVEHHHPESRGFLPPLHVLEDPSALAEGDWRPEDERPQSASAPVTAPLLVEAGGQVAVLRRGNEILVLAAYGPPTDTLLRKRRPGAPVSPGTPGDRVVPPRRPLYEAPVDHLSSDTLAGLFLLPELGGEGILSVSRRGGEGVLELSAPLGGYLLSLELWNPSGRWGARSRRGVRGTWYPPDEPHLSDILLLRREGEPPATLDHAAPRLLPGTNLRSGQRLTVAWEVYGLGRRREPLSFRISLVEEEGGLIRRAFNRIGLFRKDPTLSLGWTEGGWEEPGPLFRALDVDLPPLEPGRYLLRLELDTHSDSKVLSHCRITVF